MANGNNNGMVPVLVPPQFAKFMAEFFGDKRNVLWPVANISKLPLPLDAAQPFAEKEIEGDFIYADSDSTGVIYVRFNNPAMPEIPVRTNFGIYGFPIKRIFVRWNAQAGKQVNLLYGYGAQVIPPNQDITSIGSITNPVTLSSWEGKNKTGSPGFIGKQDGTAPGAGLYRYMQLWNPAASGKTLLLDTLEIRSSVINQIFFQDHNAAIGAVIGNSGNKNLGDAGPSAELRMDANAAPPGTIFGTIWSSATISEPRERIFEEPIRIPAGRGLIMRLNALNAAWEIGWEWREIA